MLGTWFGIPSAPELSTPGGQGQSLDVITRRTEAEVHKLVKIFREVITGSFPCRKGCLFVTVFLMECFL